MNHEETTIATLEKTVDRFGLLAVVHMLEQVCAEKAEHLRSNWQDESSAKTWERDGKRLMRAANHIENETL